MRQPMTKTERHAHILRTAKRLFQQSGYDHVTIADVIKASNIARGTFYLHFDSLESLLTALFEEVVNETWKKIAPILEQVEDPEACTIETVHAVFRIYDNDNESMISVFSTGGGEAFTRKKEEALYGKLGRLVVKSLMRRHEKLYGKTEDDEAVQRLEWTVAMIISLVTNMSYYASLNVAEADKTKFEQQLVDFVVAGTMNHLTPILRPEFSRHP